MERGRSPLDGSVSVLNRPRSPRRRSRSGRSLLADPLWVDRGRPGGGPGKPSMKSGVGLAPKEVRALLHALFPDAEPQCRTGTHLVPPSASGRKDDFRALPKRSRRGHQFNRHGCEKPLRAASRRRRSPGPRRYPYANGARSSLFRPPPWPDGRTRRLALQPGPQQPNAAPRNRRRVRHAAPDGARLPAISGGFSFGPPASVVAHPACFPALPFLAQ